jgi:hypothetical protein
MAVAWEGLDELVPPPSVGGIPQFTTTIFLSFSTDGGSLFSPPMYVAAPGTTSGLLPALAYAPNGTLYIAYLNATNTDNEQLIVASAAPGMNFTPGVVVYQAQDLEGHPWLKVLPDGEVVLAFDYAGFVEWLSSVNGGRTFDEPTILLQGILTGGTLWESDRVTLVGLSTGADTAVDTGSWTVTFNATGAGGAVIGTGATISFPYPVNDDLPNFSRPGPSITFADGLLYLFFATDNETELAMQTSSTNGSTWAGVADIWSARATTIEMPVVNPAPDGTDLALAWLGTEGGFWKAYSALYDGRTGLLSVPTTVSGANGFPAAVRDWHGITMGFATTGSHQYTLVWGDGRGLSGTYGLTHLYACTLTSSA